MRGSSSTLTAQWLPKMVGLTGRRQAWLCQLLLKLFKSNASHERAPAREPHGDCEHMRTEFAKSMRYGTQIVWFGMVYVY